MNSEQIAHEARPPWNKNRLIGQKARLTLREIWAIRIRLQLAHRTRDLVLFNLAIDSKLRAAISMGKRFPALLKNHVISQGPC